MEDKKTCCNEECNCHEQEVEKECNCTGDNCCNEKENKEVKKVEIYDKAFFLNEEMNNLKGQLEKLNENMSNSEE